MYLILITSNASRQDVLSGLTSGADDYVVKPFDWEELRARVRIGARTATLQQTLAERVKELQAAMSRVRVLDGLLPDLLLLQVDSEPTRTTGSSSSSM